MDQEKTSKQLTTSQNKSLTNTTQNETPNPRDKNQHIAVIVAQSYNVFNRYGKDGEALKDITRAFIEDLQPFSILQITYAFREWRQRSDGMPAPSNIIDIIQKGVTDNRKTGLLTWSEFQQRNPGKGWRDFKFHLNENNALSEKLRVNL